MMLTNLLSDQFLQYCTLDIIHTICYGYNIICKIHWIQSLQNDLGKLLTKSRVKNHFALSIYLLPDAICKWQLQKSRHVPRSLIKPHSSSALLLLFRIFSHNISSSHFWTLSFVVSFLITLIRFYSLFSDDLKGRHSIPREYQLCILWFNFCLPWKCTQA